MRRVLVAAAVVVGGVAAYLLATRAGASVMQDGFGAVPWVPWGGGDGGGGIDPAPWVPVVPAPVQTGYDDMIVSMGGASTADANLAAFLSMIRSAEGTAGQRGYQTMFGYRYFDSFADHPRQKFAFQETTGRTNYTTAAGAYQFLADTWDGLKRKLGLLDFSPDSQDRAAVELIREKGALADVMAGRFEAAVAKLGTIWASLPSSAYPQGKRSMDFVRAAYEQAGGKYA